MPQRSLDEFDEFRHRGHPWGMDVIDYGTDLAFKTVLRDVIEDLHSGAGRFDAGDISVEGIDRVDDLPEFRIAQVRVDLGARTHLCSDEPERTHGPVEVVRAVGFAQRQQLPQGGFVDLDDTDSGRFEVEDLIGESQGDLVGGFRATARRRERTTTARIVTGPVSMPLTVLDVCWAV